MAGVLFLLLGHCLNSTIAHAFSQLGDLTQKNELKNLHRKIAMLCYLHL